MTKSITTCIKSESKSTLSLAITLLADKAIARTLTIRERSLINKKLRNSSSLLSPTSSKIILV